jgi:glycosyltransferase involved in cell wall biosynthesis
MNIYVMMLGFRGFPGVQGGVETHVENLSRHLVELGCQIHAITRSTYKTSANGRQWHGVYFTRLWVPKLNGIKGVEAIVHTFVGVLYAALKRPDILHIHAIGPSLLVPLARMLGLTVVITHHGPDYERQKWARGARLILKLGERLGMCWANERIVISRVIQDLVMTNYGKASVLIPNGVVLPELPDSIGTLSKFGLSPGKYVLIVSRIVPEKRHLDLICAFKKAALPGWILVIVGDSDHPDDYSNSVFKAVNNTQNVISTGFQAGQSLQELFAHAGLFVLPSSHEGLPIALLEALSYGLPVIASDIPANLEIGLPEQNYFRLGDIEMLAHLLHEFSSIKQTEEIRNQIRLWVSQRYNWAEIARSTLQVYLSAMDKAT